MKDDIERRFELNLGRAKGLITAYEAALPGVAGRPSLATTDILRASVVFLHATLEDLLRSILAWKLPSANPEHMEQVPLAGERLRKYTLADIAKHRGLSVDDLLERSVAHSLEHSNFNSVEEVGSALARSGLATAVIDPFGKHLAAMMSRRHWIVHRADRNEAQGSGHFAARSLSPTTVQAWVSAVNAFGDAVLALV